MPGPYETEPEAMADVRDIYDAGKERGAMARLNAARLFDACEAAGVDLGRFDRRALKWLSGWEPQICQAIAEIIRRAHAKKEN